MPDANVDIEEYVVDSNAFNVLTEEPEVMAYVDQRTLEGSLRLWTTEGVVAEVEATPDTQRRRRLLGVPATIAPGPFILGESLLDGPDVLVSTGEYHAFMETRGTRHFVDGGVLGLADRLGLPLVTEDRRLLARARRLNVPTSSPTALLTTWGVR